MFLSCFKGCSYCIVGSVREEKFYKAFKEDVFIRREEKVNHLKVNLTSDREEAGIADDDSVVFGDTAFNERNETDPKAVNNDDEDEGIKFSCMFL